MLMKMKVACVPAGRTSWDLQGRMAGSVEVPLSDHGVGDIEKLGDPLRHLAPRVVYGACTDPSKGSAAILADALGVRLRCRAELRELDMGIWQGLLIEEIVHKHPKAWRSWQRDPFRNTPAGAEDPQDTVRRVRSLVDMLDRKHAGDSVVLVAGRMLCRIVESVLSRRPPEARSAPCAHRAEPYVVVERVPVV